MSELVGSVSRRCCRESVTSHFTPGYCVWGSEEGRGVGCRRPVLEEPAGPSGDRFVREASGSHWGVVCLPSTLHQAAVVYTAKDHGRSKRPA